ncbi:MAG: 2-oxoacid:acceptor oxidoreductase family protein, partial [Pseudomonadota bacterium]
DIEVVKIPANELAAKLGSDRTLNMIMLGAFAAKTRITTLDSIMNGLTESISAKKAALIKINRKGMDMGAEYALRQG